MSIIQEALKKAQGSVEEKRPSQEEKPKEGTVRRRRGFKALPLLLILFAVTTIFILRQFILEGGPKKKGSMKADSIDTASHQEVTYKPITSAIEPESNSAPQGLKPFEKPSERSKFILNGIMYLNDGPRAIINDSVVSEGDMVGGARVMKITKSDVVLNLNDLEITLSLKR